MEIQQMKKTAYSKVKQREKLNASELNIKIESSQLKIRDSVEIIKRFNNDLEPHLSPDFQKALKRLHLQYSWIVNYDVTQDERRQVRVANANTLIISGALDAFVLILPQLFSGIFDQKCTEIIEETVKGVVKQIMFTIFNYADASAVFGDEVCKKDKLLSFYHRILVFLQEPCVQGAMSEDFVEILRTTIATLYNTLIYDSEENLQKIRHLKFLDIIKNFLLCSFERIKISSLLFTAYVANEGDSVLFKSDQESISYLSQLLSESMKMKSGRAKGLSTEELAKGIAKLSRNDENKQLLVDLGVLPILKKLMEKDLIKYKEISLSILWSLAFDERNRKVINEMFSTILSDMKKYLNKPDNEAKIDQGSQSNDGLAQNSRQTLISAIKNEEGNDLQYSQSTKVALDKSKCSQVLDGLLWTLQDSQTKTMTIGSQAQNAVFDINKTDGHIMISYCWANADVVMEIYNALKDLGYKLWIDKYNMAEHDNLMESMAHAVENSIALIACISNGYKDSANCRAEAQYAVSKKKPLIPVMVQHKYRPDGWLGFCITGLMYFDFKGRHSFQDSLKDLSKQLKRLPNSNNTEVDSVDHVTEVIISTENQNPDTISVIKTWSNTEVNTWFKDMGIKKISWKSEYTGHELHFMKLLSERSFDSFVRIAENKLGLTDLKDLRIFYESLKNI